MRINDIIRELQTRLGQKKEIQKDIIVKKKKIKELQTVLLHQEEAQKILIDVSNKTQEKLNYNLSELTSLCLNTVMKEDYKFKFNFESKRGKVEGVPFFVKGQRLVKPCFDGGSPKDIASFSLRISSWKLLIKKTRNTFILDEPFKNVSKDLQPQLCKIIQRISKDFGIQFIIVSHNEELIKSADKIFVCTKKKGITDCK